MGLFEALATRPLSPRRLAISMRLYRPAVEAWCSAALAYHFLTKSSGGKLRLREGLGRILINKSHPLYLGGQFSYLAERSLKFGGLERLFKNGDILSDESAFQAIEEATHWDHYAFMRAVSENGRLHNLMSDGCNFADVGCGTGSLIAKLHKRYPRSTFFGIDPSAKAASVARRALIGQATIVKVRAEDLKKKAKFDMVYLGESLYSVANKEKVLLNCARSLKTGGTLAVLEGLMPARAVSADDMVIKGMQLDFALYGHRFMTRDELSALMKKAGLKAIRFRSLGGSVYLVTARK
jgi:ubiquinone/menaquinone biosynthesis C-methylase UbiE